MKSINKHHIKWFKSYFLYCSIYVMGKSLRIKKYLNKITGENGVKFDSLVYIIEKIFNDKMGKIIILEQLVLLPHTIIILKYS